MEKNSIDRTLAIALVAVIFMLLCVSLLIIYSASAVKAMELVGSSHYFLQKQSITLLVGTSLFFICPRLQHLFPRLPLPLTFLAVLLLTLIFIPGVYHSAGGAARWIKVGSIGFQVSELAKISLIFFLAKNLSRPSCDVNKITSGLASSLVVVALLTFLIMFQPDFGTCFIMAAVTIIMFIVSGLSRKWLFAISTFSLVGVVAAILAAPYRMKRIFAFIDPWEHAKTGGFQIIQSYLAFQNGGFFGLGFGNSLQKLHFLPEAHTDFILSVVGEELGMMGVIFICLCYALICYIGFQIAKRQKLSFYKFLAFGITSMICVQAFINMAVALGMLPTKGIPLPFVSTGSSSLLSFMFLASVLFSLAWNNRNQHDAKT